MQLNYPMKKIIFIKNRHGFTLVEILVVLGLFSSIATLSLGALLNAQTVNARLQETQAILDNMNLSIQTITREIRFGSDFHCTYSLSVPPLTLPTNRNNCPFGTTAGTMLIFKSSEAVNDLDRVAYYIRSGILYKVVIPSTGASTILQMTSDDVRVTSLTFHVDGANTSTGSNDVGNAVDYKQPLVTLYITGVTRPAKASTPPSTFDIETAVSARELDIK